MAPEKLSGEDAKISETEEQFIDLYSLGSGQQDFEVSFLSTLMEKQPFEFTFKPDTRKHKKLEDILSGQSEPLRLSYPLFRRQTPGEVVVYPIINLPLEWVKDEDGSIRVYTTREEEAFIDEQFKALIQDLHGDLITDIVDQVLDPSSLNAESLQQLANELIVLMKLDDSDPFMGLKPLHVLEEDQVFPFEKDKVLWSGFLGFGQTTHYPILELAEEQPEEMDQEGEEAPEPTPLQVEEASEPVFEKPQWRNHPFHAFASDSDQARVFFAMENNPEILVEGVSGTGKTQLLSSIITNTLAHGKRILVIAKDLAGMSRIFARMQEIEIDHLCLMVKDAEIDRDYFIEKIRKRQIDLKERLKFDEDAYELKVSHSGRELNRLRKGYEDMNKPVFKGQNWLTTVGRFLEKHQKQARTLLTSELSPEGFQFDDQAHTRYLEAIKKSEALFLNLNTLKHPLEILDERIFIENGEQDALEFVKYQVKRYELDSVNLFHNFISILENYGQDLVNHYTEYYESLRNRAIHILEDINDFSRQYGEDFDDAGVLKNYSLAFRGIFSKRSKNILHNKHYVEDQYGKLEGEHQLRAYFNFEFVPTGGMDGFEKIRENLDAYLVALDEWKQQITTRVHEELQSLNSKQIHPSLQTYNGRLKDLEREFPHLLKRINESGFLGKPQLSEAFTLIGMQKFLSGLIDKIEVVKHNLQDFPEFYHWKNYWLTLPADQQKLIESLIEVRPSDWQVAFESWFLHHTLEQSYTVHIPRSDDDLHAFTDELFEIKKWIPKKIRFLWQNRQLEALKHLRKENRNYYQQLFAKKNGELIEGTTLESLWLEDFEFNSAFFPILLCTPESGIPLMPRTSPSFELAILDNAENQIWESSRILLNQASQRIVTGNPYGKALSDDYKEYPTVLEMARATTYKPFQLNYFHRQVNPFVLLANQQIYDYQLNMLPQKDFIYAVDVQYNRISGVFDEEKMVNEEEVDQILGLLGDVKANSKGFYPRTGIVTMTTGQKERIEQQLRKVKFEQDHGAEVVQRLERFGMEVCTIEEINQYKFETIFLSCTYDAHTQVVGNWLDHLDQPQGFGALQNLCLYPFKSLYIISSLMNELLRSNPEAQPGRNLLGSFLQTAFDISHKRFQRLESELQTRPVLSEEKQSARILINEVTEVLGQYVDPSRFEVATQNGSVRLDLVIHPIYEKQAPIAVRCDGFYTRQQDGAYAWDRQIIEKLEEQGYVYYNIWSANWWRKPYDAQMKLVSFILQHDKRYDREPRIFPDGEETDRIWDST